jgi:nitronate monooxygenase
VATPIPPASANVQTGADTMSPDELRAFLDELLAAERAGVRVAAALRDEQSPGATRALLDAVRADEAQSCALLAGALGLLGAPAGARVGEFAAKALAVEGRRERVAFLQRGQRWVVRRLNEVLPRIAHPGVADALRRMLELHDANVAACDAALASWRDADPDPAR